MTRSRRALATTTKSASAAAFDHDRLVAACKQQRICKPQARRSPSKAAPLSGIDLMRGEGPFAVRTKNPARFPGRAQ
jgi:hypothetical protein